MASFKAIYEAACARRGETPDHIRVYQGLDEVWDYVAAHPKLMAALDGNRVCIAVPAPCPVSNSPKYFYDVETESKQPLYLYDPATDSARAEILNKLAIQEPSDLLLYFYKGKRGFLRWQLQRLERRYRAGTWEQYAEEYSG